MYISKFYDKNGTEFIVLSSITEDQFGSVQNAVFRLRQFLNETDHYITVFENAKDFIESLKEKDGNSETMFIRINRCFSNYLNSFYTWGCFHNHQSSWCFTEQYKSICTVYQEQNIVYGLAKHLRNYTTHNGFAIYKFIFEVFNEKAYYMITPHFFEYAEEKGKANKKVKKYLAGVQAQGIDAYQFTIDFLAMFQELQTKIWKEAFGEIQKEVNVLLNVAAPTPPDCYNSYIVKSDDESFCLHIGRILELYTKRMQLLQIAI